MSIHKISPTNPRLATLLSDVAKGNIKIPAFQRKYVWEDEQIMSLLDSIYRGYPVGSLLLWSTKERLVSERQIGGFELPATPEDYPVLYVLDGQQRLTTLYGVFNSNAPTGDPELAARLSVCFAPDTEEFLHFSESNPSTSINLRHILDTTKLLPELLRFTTKQQANIATLTERFKDYEFPVVTIRDRSNQEVCRVFQRINSSGTTLSSLELLAAWTWSEQFNLTSEIEGLRSKLSDIGYEDIGIIQVMRCLAAIVRNDIETDTLVDALPSDLIAGMQQVKEAMNAAIDFLDGEFKIRNSIFVPFPIMLVPLVRFFALKPKPNANQRLQLRRWFWYCSFTQRYIAGTNKAVLEDLYAMKDLAEGRNPFTGLSASVPPSLFTKTWRINSTAAKATICLLAQFSPRSFPSNTPINLGSTLAAYNARQFHHIYPKNFLSGQNIPFHEANAIANICMLTADDNQSISDADPSEYFRKIPAGCKQDAFKRALIPVKFYAGDRSYADFIQERSTLLAKVASQLIATGVAN